MSKSREHIVTNGRAAFYASIWPDLLKAANDCGWALGLHGSLANDMDMMAMPWIEEAKPVEDLMQALSDCFTGNMWKDGHIVPHTGKPNNRIVYTMSIWADLHLDINIISNEYALPVSDEDELWKVFHKRFEYGDASDVLKFINTNPIKIVQIVPINSGYGVAVYYKSENEITQ